MLSRKFFLSLQLSAVILMLFGCNARDNRITGEPKPPVSNGKPEYRLQPGDVIKIRFFYNPGLSVKVLVRPDGRISLDLVGEVVAADMTPNQLSELLYDLYSTELKDPSVTVVLEMQAFKPPVYVAGEVNIPGLYNIENNMTALQAVIGAGG